MAHPHPSDGYLRGPTLAAVTSPSADHPPVPEQAAPSPELVELASRLFDMARSGDTETLRGYLDAGIPVDLRNQAGDSLLMLAAYHGHASTVSVLLGHGADADLANDKGQTPLAGAVFKGFDDVVEVLVGAGADPHGGSPSADTAATMFGREDLRELWS
ncbi:ankyrin repeat domain-containing protein [Gordonia jinghuaiqii]|uniref:Ankyrin repeat domain-containing protein n=1 Tax=Gordonia jinghuaiqii TaxID=2758710 RepID=A0A7D7R0N6_9ACTN|nr:ankyrin repeat domain-containing protein [Gordonia jinghuaiqii]QMT03669.1 ankyrin repeat domain-containing protein [Gordonia jinghuaiqii]